MNQEQIRQTLHDIAQDNIPDETDLWPGIQAHLPRQQTTRPKPVRMLVRVAVAMAIFLTMGMVSYAVYQNLSGSDPGLEAAHDAGLVTELNLSETIDNITVILDWAYADANRVVINYRIEAQELAVIKDQPLEIRLSIPQSGTRPGAGFSGRRSIYTHPSLLDTDPDNPIMYGQITLDTMDLVYPSPDDLPDEFDVRMEISFLQRPHRETDTEDEVRTPIPMSDLDTAVGPFPFDFAVPVIQTVTITPTEQTVEINGLDVVVREVRLTPSMTRTSFCYALPRQDEGWMPSATLSIDQVDVSTPGTINWISRDWDSPKQRFRFCIGMDFPVPYTEQPSTLTLTIHELMLEPTYLEERALELQAVLAEQGIETEIYGSQFGSPGLVIFPLGVVSAPDGVDPFAALAKATEALTERVAGPWVFEIAIP